MTGRWLAKLHRYDGTETVLGYYEDLAAANERVAEWNSRYQTDTAYVEAWDATKAAEWPTASRRRFENGLMR